MQEGSPDAGPKVRGRGTSNTNERGSAESRRRRRQWLVDTYRADVKGFVQPWSGDVVPAAGILMRGLAVPVCRCYRCGKLLTVDTVTVDRIIPGCKGGTYRRNNIRPACAFCNSSTGSLLARRRSA